MFQPGDITKPIFLLSPVYYKINKDLEVLANFNPIIYGRSDDVWEQENETLYTDFFQED